MDHKTDTMEKLTINGKTFFFNHGKTQKGDKFLMIYGYAGNRKDNLLVFENQLAAFIDTLQRAKLKLEGRTAYSQIIQVETVREPTEQVEEFDPTETEQFCPGWLDETYRETFASFEGGEMESHSPSWEKFHNELGNFKVCTVCGYEVGPKVDKEQ